MKLADLEPELSWRKGLLAVIAAYVLLSVYSIFLNQGLWWDEAIYLGLSDSLQNGYYSLYPASSVESFRQPLFPMLLALLRIDTVVPARLLVMVFGLATVAMTYLVGKKAYGSREGLIAASMTASFHLFLYFQSKILTETLFTFLLMLSVWLLLEKGYKHSFLGGLVTGLAFMARYPGGILFPIYGLWLWKRDDVKQALTFGAGSLIALIPLFWIGQVYYGNPLGAPLFSLDIVSGLRGDPWYFFLSNFFFIFGPLGLVVLAGAVEEVRERDYSIFLVIGALAALSLSIQGHKELRYLVAFFPAFALVGASWYRFADKKKLVTLVVVVLAFFSLFLGHQKVWGDKEGGKALKEAAQYLKELPGDKVVSEYYSPTYPEELAYHERQPIYSVNPWIEILSDKQVSIFPQNMSEASGIDADYAVIYAFGPSVPDYAPGYAAENYEELRTFEQWGNASAVTVYRVPEQ